MEALIRKDYCTNFISLLWNSSRGKIMWHWKYQPDHIHWTLWSQCHQQLRVTLREWYDVMNPNFSCSVIFVQIIGNLMWPHSEVMHVNFCNHFFFFYPLEKLYLEKRSQKEERAMNFALRSWQPCMQMYVLGNTCHKCYKICT